MLSSDRHMKLASFYLCEDGIVGSRTARTLCGTPNYMAPEVFPSSGILIKAIKTICKGSQTHVDF